jgi:isopenicillin-N epimerase
VGLPYRREDFADRLFARVTDRTRVIFLSHITSATALILPVEEVVRRARERGILTVVDGAHAPGQVHLDLDALGADFYTGNCHKWMCAPKGAAFLHARRDRHALLDGPVVSWGYTEPYRGHAAYAGTTLLERRLQWQGTRDLSAFLSVPAAIAFQARNGWDAVREDCHRRVVATLHAACALTGLEAPARDGDFPQMAILPVPAGDPEALKEALFRDHRIEVPVTAHGASTFVRISLQAYNGPGDEAALLGALRRILGRQRLKGPGGPPGDPEG